MRAAPLVVKVCGVRAVADVHALEVGAGDGGARIDHIGVNLVADARRAVDFATAAAIVAACVRIVPVGVVRDQAVAALAWRAHRLGLRWLQLHGDEPPEAVAALAADFRVVKALTPAQRADPGRVRAYGDAGAAALLFDGDVAGAGVGHAVDAAALGAAGVPVWLAGGLRPDNVGAKVAALRPAGVDAASGVEVDGRFDVARALTFARAARAAIAGAA